MWPALEYAPMLHAVAELWIVSDRLDQAEAIVVLGGGLGVRPAAAADLYRRGISPRVVVARAETDRGRHARLNIEALMRHGVPPSVIATFNYRLLSTYGEARGVRDWARSSGINSVVIPIDIFSARRVRWIFNRILGPAGIRVTVHAVAPPWYNRDDWWRHEEGRADFRDELIKFAYYLLRY
jgi:uncharacterized SAM-binding protein YcdF (DUF218 family)